MWQGGDIWGKILWQLAGYHMHVRLARQRRGLAARLGNWMFLLAHPRACTYKYHLLGVQQCVLFHFRTQIWLHLLFVIVMNYIYTHNSYVYCNLWFPLHA